MTAYVWRISDWSSDVCSSDLPDRPAGAAGQVGDPAGMLLDSIGNGRTRGQLQRAGADHALRLAQKQGGIGRDRIESHLLDQRWPLAAAHDLEEAEAVDRRALEGQIGRAHV